MPKCKKRRKPCTKGASLGSFNCSIMILYYFVLFGYLWKLTFLSDYFGTIKENACSSVYFNQRVLGAELRKECRFVCHHSIHSFVKVTELEVFHRILYPRVDRDSASIKVIEESGNIRKTDAYDTLDFPEHFSPAKRAPYRESRGPEEHFGTLESQRNSLE